jgi:hypothetical protein
MLEVAPDATNWGLYAACQTAFQEDRASLELFFPEHHQPGRRLQEEEARDYCLACPVADFCLQTALREKTTYGVEGGLTGPERAKALRALAAAQSP